VEPTSRCANVKITELLIEGFRSFKSQTWRPGDLNVVIGPNASGKSNLLRFLEMIQASAEGKLAKFVQHEGGMGAIVWDGVAEDLHVRIVTKSYPRGVRLGPLSLFYDLHLRHFKVRSAFHVQIEHLAFQTPNQDANQIILERGPVSGFIQAIPPEELESQWAILGFTQADEKKIEFDFCSTSSVETSLSGVTGIVKINEYIEQFREFLANWKIYQSFRTDRDAPVRMPQVTRAETQLDPDGQNLISVLHSLYTESREFKADVNQAMIAAFGDHFEELIFPPAADQRVQMRVRWQGSKHETSTADLSDGTLRFLYLLAILANPNPAPLIAIDEPETGLHPSMLPIIADYAREAATRTQVIFTTHSPDLLTAFGDDPPTTTVTEWRENETHLKVLSGDELSYWLKNYTLGELFRSNELESMP